MTRRRQLAVILVVALAVSAGVRYALPELVRRAAIARIEAITHRHVRMDRVDLSLLAGRLTVHGFQLGDRTAGMDLTHFERLDVRIRSIALLRGHLWIRELVLRGSTVRVVRFADGFNISDLIEGPSTTALNLDVTIDWFRLIGGTVMFEDRALREPRTWTSENIQIEARNVSTRHDAGIAEASSVTAGAPVSIKLEHFRLVPIHLQAAVEVKGLDLSLARLYFPPDAPVVVDRGRASTSLAVTYDAHAGLRAAATNQIEDVALVKSSTGERLLLIPKMASRLSDFVFRDGRVEVGRFELMGSASVLDPSAPGGPRFQTSTVRSSIADLTWPVTTAGRLEVEASVPGGGKLALTGTVRPPPASSQLRLRLARVNLAPWARLLPVSAQISGLAESDLSIDEPLAAGVPAHVRGAIAVTDLAARDLGREVLRVRRVEAEGLQVRWPASFAVRRLSIVSPRALLERDKAGEFSFQHLMNASRSPGPAAPIESTERERPSTAGSPRLTIGEILVSNGTLAWRDGAVARAVALDFSRIEASARGVGWPLRGPIDVRSAVKLPGSGQVDVQGRVNGDPSAARLRVTAREADVSPYTPYLRTPAHIKGWADLEVTVDVPRSPEGQATVRGTVALSRVDVRDEQRTVLRLERGVATDVEAVWPERVAIREVALRRPWVLIDRDQDGALTLLSLLPSAPAGRSAQDGPRRSVAVALRQLLIDQGGVRVVDRSLSPPFALDMSRLAVNAEGLATAPAKPARVSITGRIADSLLDVSGTIGPLGAPVRLDVQGGLKGLWVPRTDPYLLRYVGWEARAGWLTTSIRCRIDRDALDASTDIRLSRLAVAEGSRDQAQSRIGLPLGLIVALMKDSNGDIHVSLPVGGRLNDPRFDFSEAIWSTVRNAAIKAITLPVSWIGRVRLSSDARIERVEIDPVRFQPGTATFTPEGDAQAAQLIRFLQQAPEARVLLTPMVSAEDLIAVRRRALDSELERVARAGAGQVSKDAAALRLFEQRFPHLPAPSTPEAIAAALIANQPLPASVTTELATQRVEAVRTAAKKASVDPGRLPDRKLVPESEAVESQVALDLAEPEGPERPGRRLPEFLRKLGAAASTSSERASE